MSYGFRTLRFVLASTCALLPAAAIVGQSSSAYADDEADAAAANDAGKQMMIDSNFAGASKQFSLAISKSRLAKYSLNLCNSLLYEGRYDESLQACNEANTKNPDAKTAEKIAKMIEKVRTEAHNANIKLYDEQPTGPTNPDPNNPNPNPNPDPNNPNPNPNPDPNNPNPVGPAVGRPPAVGKPPTLQKIESPKHIYTWTLGGGLAGGAGEIDNAGGAINVAGLRLHGDYLFAPQIGVGTQLRVDFLNLSGDGAGNDSANLANVGLSIYKHLPFNRIVVTPFLGFHGYSITANDSTVTDRVQGAGLFLGATAGYAMGQRGEHLISAGIDYNKSFKGTLEGTEFETNGFAYTTFSLGYTYRFNTPFGSSRSGGSFFLE